MNFPKALRHKMDEQLHRALTDATPNDALCVILRLLPESDVALDHAPDVANFSSRTEWRQALIERSQVRERQLYGSVLATLRDLHVDPNDAYAGVVVIKGRADDVINALALPQVKQGTLDGPILLIEPLTADYEFRDFRRFQRVCSLLADVFGAGDEAIAQFKALAPKDFETTLAELIAFTLAYVQKLFQAYCGVQVAVTVKILEDTEHFQTIFAAGVRQDRIESEPPILPLHGSLSGAIFRKAKPLILPDATRKTFKLNLKVWPDRLKHVQSLVGTPIFVEGGVYAVLVIDAARRGVFQKTRSTKLLAELCAETVGRLFSIGHVSHSVAEAKASFQKQFSRLSKGLRPKQARGVHQGRWADRATAPTLAARKAAFADWLKEQSKPWCDASGKPSKDRLVRLVLLPGTKAR